MPLHVPTPAEVNAAAVWAYATRLLTSLASPNDIVKFLGKGTGSEVPANTSLYDHILTLLTRLSAARAGYLDNLNNPQLLNLPNAKIMEYEIGFSSLEALDPINTLPPPDQDTTELSITVTLPEGGHIVRAFLVALITAMNNKANVQTIDVDVKGRVAGGAWRTYFSETNCVGVIPLIGATAYLTAVQDVGPTAPVAADRIVTDANLSGTPPSGTFGFKCTIVLDSANEVRFTTQYVLIIAYRMS